VTKLWAKQLRYHGSIFGTNKKLSLVQSVIPAVGSAQFHIQRVLGVRLSGHEADHSCPLSGEVKNERNYTSTPPYVLMACRGKTLPYRQAVKTQSLLCIVLERCWFLTHHCYR
jgi:hypothetical protein